MISTEKIIFCVTVTKQLGYSTGIRHHFTVNSSLPHIPFHLFYFTYRDNVDPSHHPYTSALLVIT